MASIDSALELIRRGADEIIPEEGLVERLESGGDPVSALVGPRPFPAHSAGARETTAQERAGFTVLGLK